MLEQDFWQDLEQQLLHIIFLIIFFKYEKMQHQHHNI